MDERPFDERDETPTLEVRVWRHGELVQQELCESEEQAGLVVEAWEELDGVECEIDDLIVHHGPDEIAEPEVGGLRDEDHAEAVEQVAQEARARRYD